MSEYLKVLIPYMPTAEDISPFLRRIDVRRWYTNGGPLTQDLQGRLGTLMHSPHPVAAVANGTLALEFALRALNLPAGATVLMPTVTFRASALATLRAGMEPMICEVHPRSWDLVPDIAHSMPRTEVVMPVAAFGKPVDVEPWERYAEATGCYVVIDAAGALPAQRASRHPRVVVTCSLHATKAIGAGEGGIVAAADTAILDRVRRLANFGFGDHLKFDNDGSTNGKFSEYHAAAALASLHVNRMHGAAFISDALRDEYDRLLPASCARQYWGSTPQTDHIRTLMPVLLPDTHLAAGVSIVMQSRDIETRQWYVPFLHQIPTFAPYVRTSRMDVPNRLAERLLGLPFHAYMDCDDVKRVCAVLSEIIG